MQLESDAVFSRKSRRAEFVFLFPVRLSLILILECIQLIIICRWVLIAFKREFPFDDILRLWEVLWTDYYSNEFVLFVALAVLESHRDMILRYLVEFDEILKVGLRSLRFWLFFLAYVLVLVLQRAQHDHRTGHNSGTSGSSVPVVCAARR
jgi:hypothetical protein